MDKILVVVDYQNDFVDGALGFPGAEKLDAGIAAKVREYGPGKVFFTRDTHTEDYLNTREGRNLPIVHCIKGSFGWEVYGETKKALEEVGAVGFDKGAFALNISPRVNALLPHDVENIELVGLVSNICVLATAVIFQCRYPQAQMFLDASLTGSSDPVMNEKCLDVMESFQVKIINR